MESAAKSGRQTQSPGFGIRSPRSRNKNLIDSRRRFYSIMTPLDQNPGRPDARRFAAAVVIIAATGIALGHTLRQPALMAANDISRWCTVWSLLERGSYVIDECPWQIDTQDKVFRSPKGAIGSPDGQEPVRHYYSSKPAILPTLIAGILYPARLATGVPLDRVVLEERAPRWTQKPDPCSAYGVKGVLETPKEPVRWPAYIFYFKPVLVLLNVSLCDLSGSLCSRARPLRGE